VAALPTTPIRALKLGDWIYLTDVARGPSHAQLQRGGAASTVWGGVRAVTFVQRGRFSWCLKSLGGQGVSAFRGSGAPKYPHTRPQVRTQNLSN
jgi:hypothetical protein